MIWQAKSWAERQKTGSAARKAWSQLHREPLRPFELRILQALDRAYLDAARDRQGGGENAAASAVQSRPMSPALFDAIFS